MSQNPLNLILRFILEIAALIAQGYWGWTQHEGIARLLLGIGIPLIFAALWGIFRVPGDPKDAPVAVPGVVRLLLEAAFFGAAVGLLIAANQQSAATLLGILTLVHYVFSYDRIVWLLKQR